MICIVIMDVITVLLGVSVTIICDVMLHLELNFIDNDLKKVEKTARDEDFVTYVTQLWVYGPKQLCLAALNLWCVFEILHRHRN